MSDCSKYESKLSYSMADEIIFYENQFNFTGK